MAVVIQNWQKLLWASFGLITVVVVALICHYVLLLMLPRITRRTATRIDDSIIRHLREPARWIMIFLGIRLVLPLFNMSVEFQEFLRHIFSLAVVALVSWLLIKSTNILDDYVLRRFDVDQKDNLRARKIHTQLNVIKRIVITVVVIIAAGTMLMTFDKVRQLGTTILASAGIVGIVVGLAAQKTIGTFIAGLQIALTQPIRIDDVVIVEGEWGRIEEITLTYVVVKIWDLRRLVVPITYFIEEPFQNWTRATADLLGTVFLYVDYTVPVEAVRKQLQKILKKSKHWDGKVCVLQVTNTTDKTVELRALMSAVDASTAWTLRCEVREKLVLFIQDKYPNALPKVRAEFEKLPT